MQSHNTFDAIVIGSGPGASVTASYLQENGLKVLMLEEGRVKTSPDFSREELVNDYRDGGMTFSLGIPKILYAEGRCLGGGSEVNAGLYHRTPEMILNSWNKSHQLQSTSMEDLLPHFQKIEEKLQIAPREKKCLIDSKLIQGAENLNWKHIDVPVWNTKGFKYSMSKTFHQSFTKAGGILHSNTRVLKLSRHQNIWTVITTRRIFNAPYVFIGAGTIQTPYLLRKSGFKKNIGNSFQLHPFIKVLAEFNEEVNDPSDTVSTIQIKEFAPEFTLGHSISRPEHLAMQLLDEVNEIRTLSLRAKYMSIGHAATSPKTHGKIRKWPLIDKAFVSYQLTKEEIKVLKDASYKLAELFFAANAKRVRPGAMHSRWVSTLAEYREEIDGLPTDYLNLMSVHLFGTCPMGEDQTKTAVNSWGKLHETQGLYVCDGSLLCSSPSVNPQGTIMAFARRNAEKFLKGQS